MMIIKPLVIFIFSMVFFSCKTNEKQETQQEAPENTNINYKKLENTLLSSGTLFRIDSFPSKFIKTRSVDIWLPEEYSIEKKYAVLYMNDGQNLFDSTTTWNNQEWKVDEWASLLMKKGKTRDFIVIGIHNITNMRRQDLFPQKAFKYLSVSNKAKILDEIKQGNSNTNLNGDNYLRFLVRELKPYIDSNFSVLTDQLNTFIAGSNMGGLMSIYAICEYPEKFGGAACLSTYWPGIQPKENHVIDNAILEYMLENIPSPANHKIYFDFSTETLEQYYPKYEQRVNQIFASKYYTSENYQNLKFEDAIHSENSWNKRLDIPLTFLLHQ